MWRTWVSWATCSSVKSEVSGKARGPVSAPLLGTHSRFGLYSAPRLPPVPLRAALGYPVTSPQCGEPVVRELQPAPQWGDPGTTRRAQELLRACCPRTWHPWDLCQPLCQLVPVLLWGAGGAQRGPDASSQPWACSQYQGQPGSPASQALQWHCPHAPRTGWRQEPCAFPWNLVPAAPGEGECLLSCLVDVGLISGQECPEPSIVAGPDLWGDLDSAHLAVHHSMH